MTRPNLVSLLPPTTPHAILLIICLWLHLTISPKDENMPPYFSLAAFIILCCSVCITQYSGVITRWMASTYMVLAMTHLSWAWNLLISHLFAAPTCSGDELESGNGITRYEGEEEEECAVCLSKIEAGDEIRELKCAHLFHRVCLDRWIRYKRVTCPLCRGSLAPPRKAIATAVGDQLIGEQVVEFRFCSFSSGHRSYWWLR